jgi:hypothetical protein
MELITPILLTFCVGTKEKLLFILILLMNLMILKKMMILKNKEMIPPVVLNLPLIGM